MFVLDSHCDTPSQLLRLLDPGKDNPRSHVDFPKLRAGGVDAAFFALYTPNSLAPDAATRYALQMLAAVYDAVQAHPESVAMAFSPDEAMANKAAGRTSILLGMENGSPIQESLSLLRQFYRMGVRYVTLTHNGDNAIADSAAEGTHWHGLSPFGKKVVAEMNRLGMIVDTAHVSDETFFDCIRHSKAPVVSTHSCCRALASHRRNMSDDMLRALSDAGGVIQINFYPVFLSDAFARTLAASGLEERMDVEAAWIADPADPQKRAAWYALQDELASLDRPSCQRVVDHIDHAVEVAGIDSVGIGSDFDGIEVTPRGLENIACLGAVFEEMRRRGYSETEIAKVAGGNFLRVFNEVIRLAQP